jgi:hypothetical protein
MAVPADWDSIQDGMSLRDYFAGQALAGIMADPSVDDADKHGIAKWSYRMADAMLEVRGDD